MSSAIRRPNIKQGSCVPVTRRGNSNVRKWRPNDLEDGCAATENILLACTAHGIGSFWVAGHKKAYADSVKKLLNVPEPYTLISLIAAGYSKQKPSLKKKSLDEVSFFNRAGCMKKKG